MPIRRIVTSVALIAVVAGCGSSATSAPGAATSPASAAPASAAPTGAAIASSQPSAAATGGSVPSSVIADPDLAGKFPKEIAGKPVTNVTTGRMVDFFVSLQTPQAQIDKLRADMTAIGVNLDTLIVGFGQATVGTSTVQIEATRAPGVDANKHPPGGRATVDQRPGYRQDHHGKRRRQERIGRSRCGRLRQLVVVCPR